mmetsp:Transcript_12773/g.37442  ORF Transcript_12773/g.37442 Transcript_12773/m.37442 type:complete len:99 (+) Transcript_12773:636-932(+)
MRRATVKCPHLCCLSMTSLFVLRLGRTQEAPQKTNFSSTLATEVTRGDSLKSAASIPKTWCHYVLQVVDLVNHVRDHVRVRVHVLLDAQPHHTSPLVL